MITNLSINSDVFGEEGGAEETLRLIHEAGFRYLHWCHHWSGDYLYSYPEVVRIGRLLNQYELTLVDLHASHGTEKYWCSLDETARLAGEELLLNRIRMTHDLGGRAIVLHPATDPLSDVTKRRAEQGVRTLAAVEPMCRHLGVRVAIENLFDNGGDAALYDMAFYVERFSPDVLGVCWDTGHSNIIDRGIDRVAPFMDRLAVLHLNDNHGASDEHLPIGYGTVDWNAVATHVAGSAYGGVLTQEVVLPAGQEPDRYLQAVRQAGSTFLNTIEQIRPGTTA